MCRKSFQAVSLDTHKSLQLADLCLQLQVLHSRVCSVNSLRSLTLTNQLHKAQVCLEIKQSLLVLSLAQVQAKLSRACSQIQLRQVYSRIHPLSRA
jgi:hypothetical protein